MLWILSQADAADKPLRLLLYSCAVIIGILLVAWLVIVIARRRVAAQEGAGSRVPFTLHDLRNLHATGQLTDEEFAKARDKIVAMSKAALARPSAAKPQTPARPILKLDAPTTLPPGESPDSTTPPAA
jgi:hypothetical protein